MPKEANYPAAVEKTLEALRKASKNKVSISLIKGRYCVYEYAYVDDEKTGAARKRQFYMGWIGTDGKMNPASHRSDRTRAGSLDRYLELSGRLADGDKAVHPDTIDRMILTELSMNSRMPVPEMARKIGASRSTVTYRLAKMEKSYGIRKTVEIFPEKFGFVRYLITVKFLEGRPDRSAMKSLFEQESRIQMVFLLKGGHDMLLYAVAESVSVLDDMLYRLRSDRIFGGTRSLWRVGYMRETYGFVPLRDRFFDLLKGRVWTRSRDSPRRRLDQLLMSEYATIKEMNLDAGTDFAAIDEKYGLHRGSAQYTYHRLIDKGVIERSTITMQRLPMKYCGFLYVMQEDINAFNLSRRRHLLGLLNETDTPSNAYALLADVSAPYGFVLMAPIFEGTIDEIAENLSKSIRGISVESSVVTEELIGSIGMRRFDNKMAPQLELINSLA